MERLLNLSIAAKLVAFITLFCLVYYITYVVFFHPLSPYPGPAVAAISRIPYWIALVQGNEVQWMIKLHRKYGSVVRYAPYDLSYIDGGAWNSIYGSRKGKRENKKDIRIFPIPTNGVPSLALISDADHHTKIRRILSPTVSEQAIRANESLFQKYADIMVAYGRNTKTVDLNQLLNFTVIDVMAELVLGESLGLLKDSAYTPWVTNIFQALKISPFLYMIQFYPLVNWIAKIFEPTFITKMRSEHFQHTVDRMNEHLKRNSENSSLWISALMTGALSLDDVHSNAEVFMIAGTETTASALSVLIYYLVTNPGKRGILANEIRGEFKASEDITLERLARLKYLNACIREGLRLRPPAAIGFPRIIAPGGTHILGKWVPAGTRVSVHHTATYRASENFKEVPHQDPETFVPERWLGAPEYKKDKRYCHQPFSVGPRNCIGMNLAWHEMRLIIAKLVFNFDIESDVGPDWTNQGVYIGWDRKPLECRLKETFPQM